jgi:hypothetical protein
MGMDIQPIHKQRRMLGAVCVSTVLEDIVGKLTDSVEVFRRLLHRGIFSGKAGRGAENQDKPQDSINP